MRYSKSLIPVILTAAGLTCTDPTEPPLPAAAFGSITVRFQDQSLAFGGLADSMIAYYSPESKQLTVTGVVSAGVTPPGRVFIVFDSIPPATLIRPLVRTAPYLTVAFDDPLDSSLVYPFSALRRPTDRLSLQQLDLSTCQVKGTFRASVHYAGDGPGYEIRGSFWGRFRWNTLPAGPC